MNKNLIKFIQFLLIFLAIAGVMSLFNLNASPKAEKIGIATLISQIKDTQIKKISIEGDVVKILKNDDSKETLLKENNESLSTLFKNYNLDPKYLKNLSIKVKEESGFKYWMSLLLPFLIPFIFISAIIYFMLKQVQGANSKAMMFGQSTPREVSKRKNAITFKDVAGCLEAKEELKEVVEFLINPKKFLNLGAKVPKGVLLMGPPGTGKTLLAKAVAGEAGVPFFSISGSEFVEMFVGVGASRVRDLFKKSKKNAPCIIFIDEIDAVGRQRGAGLGGSHDEREQTLNQILVEMDGFDTKTNVIVMAATNRPDVLDPALLRPGRFDRRVILDMPDIKSRKAILTVHAKNKPFNSDVNLEKIAFRTPGFSGADLANLLNEAAIFAAKQNKKKINESDIIESIEKVMLGPERRSHLLNPKEKEITAYHEAGHALVGHSLKHAAPVQKVSIISRGQAAGYTLNMPEEDKHMHSKTEFIDTLAVLVAGHTAEKEVFTDITTGASNDLQKATSLARNLITHYGMTEHIVPRSYGQKEEMIFLGKEITEHRDYSEKTAEAIDKEIDNLISKALTTAKKIISDKRDILDKLAKNLMEHETLEKEEFEKIAGKKQKNNK